MKMRPTALLLLLLLPAQLVPPCCLALGKAVNAEGAPPHHTEHAARTTAMEHSAERAGAFASMPTVAPCGAAIAPVLVKRVGEVNALAPAAATASATAGRVLPAPGGPRSSLQAIPFIGRHLPLRL